MYDHYMNCFCKDRYFEPLPGFIDVDILTGPGTDPERGAQILSLNTVPGKPYAVPICHLKACTPDQLDILANLQKDQDSKVNDRLTQLIQELGAQCASSPKGTEEL